MDAYAKAGVDIDAGAELVERIKGPAGSSKRPGVMSGLGGFGAFFDPKAAGFNDPILVSTTDGVGTKLKIAIETGRHEHIGQDLVAMCVNDLIVQGAEPLFFLDYFATGKLDVNHAATVVTGIANACASVNCALIGGETAEMPGMYGKGDYDLAGFAVGAVERGRQITGANIKPGDVVLGLASSGVHSNGYSLVRKIASDAGAGYDQPCPFGGGVTLGEALLTPTRLYVNPVVAALKAGHAINGIVHVTGGGLSENIPRIMPEGMGVALDAAKWPFLPVFKWLKNTAGISDHDMARTFNCGIGLVVIAPKDSADKLASFFMAQGEQAQIIGQVTANAGVDVANTDKAWA